MYPIPEETEETSLWIKIKDGAVKVGKGVYNTGKGAVLGGADVVKDTAVGIGNTIIHPFETMDSMANMVLHPFNTSQYIGSAIAESYERDMVNGDAESRSHWVTYALGTAVTTVFGTKGAGTVTKTGVATTKAAATKTTAAAGNTVKNMDFSQYLPYGPQYQLAGGGKVPYNVVDGEFLKDQLILKAERLSGTKGKESRADNSNVKVNGEPKIWNKVNGTAENIPNTEIPATFQIELKENISYINPQTGSNTLWTNSNATKHMGEYISRFGSDSDSIGVRSQVMLESYYKSLNGAMNNLQTIPRGRNFGVYGNWELGINTETGVVYHARMIN